MKPHTANIESQTVYYFSEQDECLKSPEAWLVYSSKKDEYRIAGGMFFIEAFIPGKIGRSFKDPNTAFSFLLALTKKANDLDEKMKKRLCMVHANGREYGGNSLSKINEVHRQLQRYVASNGNQPTTKKPVRTAS